MAVAIPAAAGSSDSAATAPDLGTVTSQLTPDASETSASATPDPSASASSAAPSASASSSADPAACLSTIANPLAALTCLSSSAGGNPLTGVISQITSLAGSGGAPGLPTAPLQDLAACVQTNLAAVPPDGTKLEGCFSTFGEAVTGAPQAKCLDPLLDGAIGAIQSLLLQQDPAALEAFLLGAQGTITNLASCLTGAATSPSPTATASTGTTTQSGGATTPTDPTEAVAVAATPTFTG
ncbi:MAG TPA: hypothetical protein VHX15_14145 [Frankiaceae bacterium]|nr:hypothetical protein [Frankiaceae bacterium]